MALQVNSSANSIPEQSKHCSYRSFRAADCMGGSTTGGIRLRRIWWRAVSLVWGSLQHRRGLELLQANLTSNQLNQFLTYRRFDVVGGASGRVYRIRFAGTMNVEEL